MKFVSLSIALDTMGEYAPRNWCKWSLLGMLNHGHLSLFSSHGEAVFSVSASQLTMGKQYHDEIKNGYRDRKGMAIPDDIEQHYGVKIDDLEKRDWDYKYLLHKLEWTENEAPKRLASGHSMWGELDWNENILTLDEFSPDPDSTFMFQYDDIVEDEIDARVIHDFNFGGLCFELQEIEQIAPQANFEKNTLSHSSPIPIYKPRVGRPAKWDWAGALGAVIVLANKPDGISVETGGQAVVERAMADWFVKETGAQPSTSSIREHAQRVMRMLDRN